MPNVLQNNKLSISLERPSYFVYLLHVVTHPRKLQCYHVVLVGYVPACLKFSEITNHQYLWRGLSDFDDFLHVVICILLDIHWSYQNFGLVLSGIGSHPITLSDVLNLQKLKTIRGINLIFCFHWSCKKYAFLGYAAKYSSRISWRIFYFWLVWLISLNTGVHCYTVLFLNEVLRQVMCIF